MRTCKLIVEDQIILVNLKVADRFVERFLGLMGKTIDKSEGLLITPCNSIHCLFMKIPIDVIFLNDKNEVIHKIGSMRPWTLSPIIKGSKAVIETTANVLHQIKIGDRVKLE